MFLIILSPINHNYNCGVFVRRLCVIIGVIEMAYKCREEIVGKRFLSVSSGFSKLKSTKISEWGWRAGVIRASTHKDSSHPDLQVKKY